MPSKGYSAVSIPTDFLITIDEFLDELKNHGISLGYNGRADFLKAGARELMMKLKTTYLLAEPEE